MSAAVAMDAPDLQTDGVETIEQFKQWTRRWIRPVFPHEALGCGYGHIHAGGVALDYVVTVDYPIAHLQGIRNRAGAIDTPILRRWLATREPQLFEADDPWPDAPADWLACFRVNAMKNAAAHAVYDTERCVGTYYSFQRIPGRLGSAHVEQLRRLVPVMHEVLCRVIGRLHLGDEFTARLAGLSAREREMAQWVRMGKTNGEIAGLSGLSENTVKHHLTNVFAKLAVETRAQLIHRLVECEARVPSVFGTRIV